MRLWPPLSLGFDRIPTYKRLVWTAVDNVVPLRHLRQVCPPTDVWPARSGKHGRPVLAADLEPMGCRSHKIPHEYQIGLHHECAHQRFQSVHQGSGWRQLGELLLVGEWCLM